MKINPVFINSIRLNNNCSFGKTYLGNDTVNTNNGKSADVFFVEYNLDNSKDWKQVKNLKALWGEDSDYTERIVNSFKTLKENYDSSMNYMHFYGLEDKYGNTLAIAKVSDDDKNSDKVKESCVKIGFIQVDPDESYLSRGRHYFGLGETLVSNIVQKAKAEYADSIELMSANEGFWKKNGYFKNVSSNAKVFPTRRLTGEDFDEYINYVNSKKNGVNYLA